MMLLYSICEISEFIFTPVFIFTSLLFLNKPSLKKTMLRLKEAFEHLLNKFSLDIFWSIVALKFKFCLCQIKSPAVPWAINVSILSRSCSCWVCCVVVLFQYKFCCPLSCQKSSHACENVDFLMSVNQLIFFS